MSDIVITDNGLNQTEFDHAACTWAFCRVWAWPGCTIITLGFLRRVQADSRALEATEYTILFSGGREKSGKAFVTGRLFLCWK